MPIALKFDINIFEFYELTISEIQTIIEAKKSKMEEEAELIKAEIYSLAQMTASFIGCVLNGKKIPSFNSVYNQNGMNVDLVKERMMDFASHVNKRGKINGS